MKKTSLFLILTLVILVLVGMGVWFFVKGRANKPAVVQEETPLIQDTDASVIKEDLLANYPNFPIYYGSVMDRVYKKIPQGYEIVQTVTDPVENIIFWYYDEFEENGWQIITEPDIDNQEMQTVEASKENLSVKVTANSVGEDTEVVITIIEK